MRGTPPLVRFAARFAAWSALAVAAAFTAMPRPARAAEDPLAAYRGRSRVVVALAPTRTDAALAEQRRLFAELGAAGRERDLALVAASDDTPDGAALRRRFGGVPGGTPGRTPGRGGFVAVLVGKDGGEKLRSAVPLGRDALFPVIDAMPMRREEMTRRP